MTENIEKNEEWQEEYERVKKRGKEHRDIAHSNAKKYRPISLYLALSIPISSAFIPFFTRIDVPLIKDWVVPIIALIVAILSIVNSVLKPTERFIAGANIAVEIYDWDFDLEIMLKQINKKNAKEIFKFLKKKNDHMSIIGKKLADRTSFKPPSEG